MLLMIPLFVSSCETPTPQTDTYCLVYEPVVLSRKAWARVNVVDKTAKTPWQKFAAIDPIASLRSERNNAKHATCK